MSTYTRPEIAKITYVAAANLQVGDVIVDDLSGDFDSRVTKINFTKRGRVTIHMEPCNPDEYFPTRITRMPNEHFHVKSWVKREWTLVYADEVGEIAYQASCYLYD